MNEILSVGLVLLAALAAGHLAQRVRVPEVTGYLLVGVMIGPAALNVVSTENVDALQFLSEIALGLILFTIGAIFEVRSFRPVGRTVAVLVVGETAGAFVLVAAAALFAGVPLTAALLLGIVAMETAPATTLMVLHEYDASGPLAETLTALLAVNNMIVLTSFGILTAVLSLGGAGTAGAVASLYGTLYGLVWGVLGSVALGALFGLALDAWSRRVAESGESMILVAGMILIAVGAARWLELSPLFVTLAMGATVVNASERTRDLIDALKRADPPLYAAFFVLAGAELRPTALVEVGIAGVAYIVGRTAGKVGGAYLAAARAKVPDPMRRYFGLCLLSSSSLAIGLTIQIRDQFPQHAPSVTGVILSAVIVFEVVGPLLTRFAILRTSAATRPTPA